MKKTNKSRKAMSTQVLFFIAMSLIMIWIIVFGLGKITDVSSTISQQEQLEIKHNLEDAFSFCSDPINSGSLKKIKLKGKDYNSICFNCQLQDEAKISVGLKEDARVLSESGVNYLLLETIYNGTKITKYDILGQLSIESQGFTKTNLWLDEKNTNELEINIKCD